MARRAALGRATISFSLAALHDMLNSLGMTGAALERATIPFLTLQSFDNIAASLSLLEAIWPRARSRIHLIKGGTSATQRSQYRNLLVAGMKTSLLSSLFTNDS